MSTRRNRKSLSARSNSRTKTPQKNSFKRRSAVARQPSGYEQLEQRQLLATFLVNSIGDDASGGIDGVLSLREAVIASSTNASFGDAVAGDATGDIIRFDSSLAGQTITLTNGHLNVTDDLMILGGISNITIDAASSSRIFNIATGETVRISRLTLTNGQSVQGGAISAAGSGTTALFEVNFNNNSATGVGGGAIYNVDDTMYITGSNFFANSATGASGSGGAVLAVAGTTAFSSSTFTQNVANRAGGAIETIDGTIFVTDSTIGGTGMDGNVAGPVGTAAPGNGGGIHVTGSAGTGVYLSNTDVLGNYAAREGGGLWNQAGATMSVRNGSLVANNTAAGNAVGFGGGGVFNNGGGLNVLDSTVSNNTASGTAGSGGGLFTTAGTLYLNNATVNGNVANRAGGGIEVTNGLTFIRNSTLGGATVADGNIAGPSGSAVPGNGGGLHVTGGSATVVIEGSTVRNNVAAQEGGGLWNQAGSTMRVRGMTVVSENTAAGNAADDGGGGIFNNGGLMILNDTTLANNAATGTNGSGGGLFTLGGSTLMFDSTVNSNTAAFAGGGLAVTGGAYLGVNNSTVGGVSTGQGNVAGNFLASTTGLGGGVYVSGSGSAAVINGSDVDNNTATTSGGGIHVALSGFSRVENNTSVSNNRATLAGSQGGGVYTLGRFVAIDAAFGDNAAQLSGGGLYVGSTGTAKVNTSTFMSNNGGTQGGGIFNDNFFEIDDSTVTLNIVSDTGGGIFTSAGKTSVVTNTTNTGNLPNNTN